MEVILEVNRFAFMQLDNPDMEKRNIDFCRGLLYGTGGVKAAVSLQQDGFCLLCREREIEHYHITSFREAGEAGIWNCRCCNGTGGSKLWDK